MPVSNTQVGLQVVKVHSVPLPKDCSLTTVTFHPLMLHPFEKATGSDQEFRIMTSYPLYTCHIASYL